MGILGGMGPGATVDFYAKLVEHTPALRDQDHIRVVIWADPTIPSRQRALLSGGEDPTPWLRIGVDRLVEAGAEIVVAPCNTIHALLGPVMSDQPVEFISIVDATVEAIQRRGLASVCLLATDGALRSGVFQNALTTAGIEWRVPPPDQQRRLMKLVYEVKAGRAGASLQKEFGELLNDIHLEDGREVCVAGCTEISTLLGRGPENRLDVIDPTLELALKTITRARQ